MIARKRGFDTLDEESKLPPSLDTVVRARDGSLWAFAVLLGLMAGLRGEVILRAVLLVEYVFTFAMVGAVMQVSGSRRRLSELLFRTIWERSSSPEREF